MPLSLFSEPQIICEFCGERTPKKDIVKVSIGKLSAEVCRPCLKKSLERNPTYKELFKEAE